MKKLSSPLFSSVESTRISDHIEKQIKTAIFSEHLKPGDRLPSEKAMSETFNASRTTVREALRSLEKDGLLTVKQGMKGGSFVREPDLDPIVNSITSILELKKVTLENLTEARLILEPEIARIAANRATRKDIKQMEKALGDLRRIVEVKERSTSTNIQFHRVIAESSKNPVLYFINNSLLNLLQKSLVENFYLQLENNRFFLDQHIRIYESIKARDENEAWKQMRQHVLTVRKIMKPAAVRRTISQVQ
jgi:GntR family transcriptional regulator, transcriptional repressor for pyruvate dehydrogenase complex